MENERTQSGCFLFQNTPSPNCHKIPNDESKITFHFSASTDKFAFLKFSKRIVFQEASSQNEAC